MSVSLTEFDFVSFILFSPTSTSRHMIEEDECTYTLYCAIVSWLDFGIAWISACFQPTYRYKVNSALHFSRVSKSSTSFGWDKGGNVTSAGWQVTLCNPTWHVSSRSSEARCKLLYPVAYTGRRHSFGPSLKGSASFHTHTHTHTQQFHRQKVLCCRSLVCGAPCVIPPTE